MRLSTFGVGAAAVAVTAGMFGAAARAEDFVLTTGTGSLRAGYATQNDYAGTLGTNFTVGANPLTVTSLGYFDGPNSSTSLTGDGLLGSHQVGIFDASGALVTSATVPAGGGTLSGEFRYVSVTPVTLAANTNYTVGGQVTVADNTGGADGDGDVFRNGDGGPTFGSGFSGIDGDPSFTGNVGNVNPNFNDGEFEAPQNPGSIYFGGSFQYTVVPEPASFGLIGLAAAGLLARRRGM
jgi:hypothetical protein